MNNLILITSNIRVNALRQIRDSIIHSLSPHGVDFTWLICKDRKVKKSDQFYDDFIDECRQVNVNAVWYPGGSDTKKNYGGDIMTEPLLRLRDDYPLLFESDPWIYVLDDDNILHPLFGYTFKITSELAENSGRRIIWLNKMRETGFTDDSYRETAITLGMGGTHWVMSTMPDPSQIILRSSLFGPDFSRLTGGLDYDYKSYVPICQDHLNEIVFQDEWNRYNGNLIHAYHNGRRTAQDIERCIDKLNTSIVSEHHLYVETEDPNEYPQIIPIPKQMMMEFLLSALDYYKFKDYKE